MSRRKISPPQRRLVPTAAEVLLLATRSLSATAFPLSRQYVGDGRTPRAIATVAAAAPILAAVTAVPLQQRNNSLYLPGPAFAITNPVGKPSQATTDYGVAIDECSAHSGGTFLLLLHHHTEGLLLL